MCMCKSCEMFCTSSSNYRLINWNNSSIKVSDKMWSVVSQINYSMSSMSSTNMTISSMSYYSLSSKMVSLWNKSSIRTSYNVFVQIKRSTIACMTISSSCMNITSGSVTISSMSYYSFGCKMISSCSSYSGLINRNNS